MSYSIFRWQLIALVLFMSVAAGAQPVITVSDEQLPDFREVYTGHFSDEQFYEVSAEQLQSPLILQAGEPFRISLDCHEGFTDSLSLTADDGEVASTRIYVRLFPETTGVFEGDIIHYSDETEDIPLSVSGTGIDTTVPEAYYEAATGTGSELKTQLYGIIEGHSVQSYSALWTHFTVTDATFDGYVWDIYADIPCEEPPYIYTFGDDQDSGTGGTSEGDVYNREHSMPRSWFGGSVDPMNTDLYHVYPVDKFVNAQRGNYPFGEVDNPQWTSMNGGKLGPNTAGGYEGVAFEPIDAYKGDLARAFFYMITRYENQIEDWTYSDSGNAMFDHNTYPGYEPWVIDMLLDWHEQDPVSQKERVRNQAVYAIQGNRNPFVDRPEFVEKIWGDTTVHVTPDPAPMHVTIYPNPSTSLIFIEMHDDITGLELYTTNGKLVKSAIPKQEKTTLNMGTLPPGIYFLHLKTPNGIIREKVIRK